MTKTEGLVLSLLFRNNFIKNTYYIRLGEVSKRRSRAGNHKSYEVDSWIDLEGYTVSLLFLLKAQSSSTLSGLPGM